MLSMLQCSDLFVEHNSLNTPWKITFMPSIEDGLGSKSFNQIGQKIPSPNIRIEQKIPSATFLRNDFGTTCSILLNVNNLNLSLLSRLQCHVRWIDSLCDSRKMDPYCSQFWHYILVHHAFSLLFLQASTCFSWHRQAIGVLRVWGQL